jgi:hypothetical protein
LLISLTPTVTVFLSKLELSLNSTSSKNKSLIRKHKECLRIFSMGSRVLLNSQQIIYMHKRSSQKSITKVVMQILIVMRKNIQMRNTNNFNLKFPVIMEEANVSQSFKEKPEVFWGKQLLGTKPTKIRDIFSKGSLLYPNGT